jgi:hypothetical protein
MLFLLDQSSSMEKPFGGATGKAKSQGVADAINRLLQNLTIRCTRAEGVRHYYDVGVFGYGGHSNGPILGGALAGQELVSIGEIADNPVRVEKRQRDDGAGGLVDFHLPIWFDPVAHNGTPMCGAFRQARSALERWVNDHPQSFPPIVINLTDGEATDGDPAPPARAVTDLSTSDGNVLVFNCHISSATGAPVLFPDSVEETPDKFARLLFQMSSPLPPGLAAGAREDGFKLGGDARGFAFNADLVDVIRFLNIGTRTDAQMRD